MIIDAKTYAGACACGRTHEMATEYCVIEAGCLHSFDKIRKDFDITGKITAVYDNNTWEAVSDRRPAADFNVILPAENLHANEHGVALLTDALPSGTEVLVAVGSGTVHDITRYTAYTKGLPFLSVPTAASVDGFCSSVAAMTWDGCKKTLTAAAPRLVIADLDIIKHAPPHLAKSGFGDMIGKYIALFEWKMAAALTGEFYCARIASLMKEATDAILESAPRLASGDNDAWEKLVSGLLLSGIAMQLMGNSRPASGAEHHISHLIETAPAFLGISSDALHGEKVGAATIIAAEEYHRLKKENPAWRDYPDMTEAELCERFGGEMGTQLAAENARDAAHGITAEQLASHWEEIRMLIDEIPTPDTLRALYANVGAMTELSEIGIPADKIPLLLTLSPCVRNRLTLMRLRRAME